MGHLERTEGRGMRVVDGASLECVGGVADEGERHGRVDEVGKGRVNELWEPAYMSILGVCY